MATTFNPLSGKFDVIKDKAQEIKLALADGSKLNIQAASDELESAIGDLDQAIGSLVQGSQYTATNPAIVAAHLQGIDARLLSIISGIDAFEWQPSVIDKDLTAPPVTPAVGDRYLIGLDTGAAVATGAWAGEDGKIAQWNGTAWQFTTPSVGMFVSADDEDTALYLFGGTLWTVKYFESTTASGFLSKAGFDIQLTNLLNQNLLIGSAGNAATSVNTSAVGDIQADTINGLTIKADVIVDADINAAAAIDFDKMEALTANRAVQLDASGKIIASLITDTELNYLDNSTENIQDQLNRKWEYIVSTIAVNTALVVGTTYLVNSSGGPLTLTLPAPAANASIIVKDLGSAYTNNITINPNAAETIDGLASKVIQSQYESVTLLSDGTNWFII
jgi:hypothetical protein